MKAEELKNKIIDILNEKPRLFDHVRVKDIQNLLLEHYDISVSERTIIKAMKSLLGEAEKETGDEGYLCSDGSSLLFADDHEWGDSKMRGLHKYGWYNMTL
jgi:FKBP-type peptidyl-prolyl cis-trans isomerase (trigger factor)